MKGFEPFAFQYAAGLFKVIEIKVIFMEWGNLPKQVDEEAKIVEMMNFLYERNYVPHVNGLELKRNAWKLWPWDIVWEKN